MVHKGKVVVDQQGRVMGKDGKLLRDKKTGNFVYIVSAPVLVSACLLAV